MSIARTKNFFISVLNKAGYGILEVEEANGEFSYWIAKNFKPPYKNNVEQFDYCKFKGIEISEKMQQFKTGDIVMRKRAFLDMIDEYLNLDDIAELKVSLAPSYRWKLYE